VGHGQVEDQAPAARCVLEVVADLHVAATLAEGLSAKERKRVERNFAVFKQAQEHKEQRRSKKAKGSK
jgi:hypothetical protein